MPRFPEPPDRLRGVIEATLLSGTFLATLLGLSVPLLGAWWLDEPGILIAYGKALALLAALFAAGLIATYIRKVRAPDALWMMGQDSRPPIIYLRSFRDDRTSFSNVLYWLLNGGAYQSEEMGLARLLGHYGPFVAIGRPGERLPKLGAQRLYVSDDEWQATVEALISGSQLTVLRVGDTEALHWELRTAVASTSPRGLLLHFPMGIRRRRLYGRFKARADAMLPHPLPEIEGTTEFIWFDDDWRPVVLDAPLDFWSSARGIARGSPIGLQRNDLRPLLEHLGNANPPLPKLWFEYVTLPVLLVLLAATLVGVLALVGWTAYSLFTAVTI